MRGCRHREPGLRPLWGGTAASPRGETRGVLQRERDGGRSRAPQKVLLLGGRRRSGGRRRLRLTWSGGTWGGVRGLLPHARGAERPAPPSAPGVAWRGERSRRSRQAELQSCGLRRRPRPSRQRSCPPGRLPLGRRRRPEPRIRRPQASGHLAQQETPGSGQGRAGDGEPEPAQRPDPAEPSEPTHGAPALLASSAGRAQPGVPSRAEEGPCAVTREPPRTLGGSAAGAAGGSPHLPALPGSPPSRSRGPAARPSQPRAMMKTLSSGNCTLSVPAKNSYRMVVLGASRVGKSSIVSRFLNGRFEDQYTPTIEDFHRKVYNIRGDMYQLDILDTSGNHPFPAMRRLSILTGDVFILVFSLDNRESFDEVKRLQKQILEVKSCLKNKTKEAAELPMVICGNKNDHSELCRQVPTTEAELLVSGDENCAYFEVSAKKNTNVDEMFYVLFSMAKLPHEMSPALHRKISVQYGDAFHPRPFCMRRVKDTGAYGMVSPFARRPSVNSDLKYIKAKVLREGQARERDKCTIQ